MTALLTDAELAALRAETETRLGNSHHVRDTKPLLLTKRPLDEHAALLLARDVAEAVLDDERTFGLTDRRTPRTRAALARYEAARNGRKP